MSCSVHPKYAAMGKPRGTCVHCWQEWFYSPYNKTGASLRLIKLLNDRDRAAMRDKRSSK